MGVRNMLSQALVTKLACLAMCSHRQEGYCCLGGLSTDRLNALMITLLAFEHHISSDLGNLYSCLCAPSLDGEDCHCRQAFLK